MTRKRMKDRARSGVSAVWPFRGHGRHRRRDERSGSGAIGPLRPVVAKAAAAAVALAALTAAFGGASASAAAVHASARGVQGGPARLAAGRSGARQQAAAVTGVTWHPLGLLAGWKSDQGTYDSGNPSWAVKGGMVYLSGSLHQPIAGHDQFAVLPAAARPGRVLYLTVYTLGGTTGTLLILPTGVMSIHSVNSVYAQDYTSLAGVSFPAATTAVHKLSLLNGWQPYFSYADTGKPAYTVTGGVVYLSGSLYQQAGTSEEFAVLPAAARPRHTLWIKTYTYNGAVGVLKITPAGLMYAYNEAGNAAQSYTSLAAISYPLGS
jgi:hypothetical protein